MRALTIPDRKLRAAVDNYAEAIIAISIRERQIADIDKEVLGSEGRLIQRVTELLRDVSERRGRVLSRDPWRDAPRRSSIIRWSARCSSSKRRGPRLECGRATAANRQTGGFTQEKFEACLKDQELLNKVRAVFDKASKEYGVKSTPTFFINGEKTTGALSIEEISKLIDERTFDRDAVAGAGARLRLAIAMTCTFPGARP